MFTNTYWRFDSNCRWESFSNRAAVGGSGIIADTAQQRDLNVEIADLACTLAEPVQILQCILLFAAELWPAVIDEILDLLMLVRKRWTFFEPTSSCSLASVEESSRDSIDALLSYGRETWSRSSTYMTDDKVSNR